MTATAANEVLQQAINILNENYANVTAYLEQVKNTQMEPVFNTICYFPATFTTIGREQRAKKYFITNNNFPICFTTEEAKYICQHITNGNGEKPVAINYREYYAVYKTWLLQCIKEFSEPINA